MNVYEMVTERIIEQMESGVIPWQKPWTGSKNGAYNRVSMKPFSERNNNPNLNDLKIWIDADIEEMIYFE